MAETPNASGTARDAGATGRARRRLRFSWLLYSLGAGMLLSLASLLIVAAVVDSTKLPESAKEPPPGLLEHFKDYAAIEIAPDEPNEPGTDSPPIRYGPLADAIGFPRDKAFRNRFNSAFFTKSSRRVKPPVLGIKQPDAETWAFVESQRPLNARFVGWAAEGGVPVADDRDVMLMMMRLALAGAEARWRGGQPEEILGQVGPLFRMLDAADWQAPPLQYMALRDASSMLTLMLKRWIESGTVSPEAARELRPLLDNMSKKGIERFRRGDFLWRLYAYGRKRTVQDLEKSWNSAVYGFIPDGPSAKIRIGRIAFPNGLQIARMAAGAMHAKSREREILAEWDRWFGENVEKAAAGAWTDDRTPKSRPDALGGLNVIQAVATDENGRELLGLSQCNMLRAGLALMADPSLRPPARVDVASDPDNPWRDPLGGVFGLIVRDGPVALFSPQRMGWSDSATQNYLEDLLKEGKDRILTLPSSVKSGSEMREKLKIYGK